MFFSRIGYTWQAMGASWEVLKRNKKLLLFPLLSGLACLAVTASFMVPLFLNGAWMPPGQGAQLADQIVYYGTLFLFYFVNFFIITFFNSAVVGAAVQELSGHEVTVGTALKSATNRLPQILGWALVAATVGLILRAIEDRSEFVGKFVVAILGAVWTATTFLVVPVLVVEGCGPVDAFKRSSKMLQHTWGAQLISGFSFGIIFLLLAIPAFIFIALGVGMGGAVGGVVAIGVAVVYLIILSLVQTTLQGIFQAVLYLYAGRGEIPDGFDRSTLSGAMTTR